MFSGLLVTEHLTVDLRQSLQSFSKAIYFYNCLFPVQRIGCFKDTSRRAITPVLEGRLPIVRGNYQRRKNAIARCSLAAARYGYFVFGVQHGGQCFAGPRAHRTYAKYGRSNRCRNGKGGPWANDVYRISGEAENALYRVIYRVIFHVISNTKKCVWPHFKTPRYVWWGLMSSECQISVKPTS